MGIDLEAYEALALALYLLMFQRLDADEPLQLGIHLAGSTLNPHAVERFFSSWAIDQSSPPRWTERTFGWDFTPYRLRPLVRTGDVVAPVSLRYVLEKGTDGLFFTVVDHLAQSEGDRASHRWRTFFGRVWDRYVAMLLQAGVGDTGRVVPEENLKREWDRSRTCDNVVLYPGAWLLVEAEARRMTRRTVAGGDMSDLERDLRRAVIDKAAQLASTITRLRRDPSAVLPGAPEEGCRFYPIVVLPGPFPLIPPIVEGVRRHVAADVRCAELSRADVDRLMILDGDDFELLLSAARALGRTPVELLAAWQSSRLDANGFTDWLTAEGSSRDVRPLPWIAEGAERLQERALAALFDRPDP